METPFCEAYITGNTTVAGAAAAGTLIPLTWTAGPTQHGEASATLTAATGKLTCKPGIYEFHFEGTIEGPLTSDSATSGDTTGTITFQFAKGGTLVTGAKITSQDVTDGVRQAVSLTKIIEITRDDLVASTPTNYVQVYALGGDSSGNDYLLREARLSAKRLY